MIKVEYLFPFNTKNGICKDIESFNSLLSAHSDISIQNEIIRYRGSEYNYKVIFDEVPNQEHSVFHVTFNFSRNNAKFRSMLKAVKNVVGVHIKDDIQIIWDGVGFEWSKQLYPKIYQVENYMRKLISKFMLVNLGIGWHVKTVPKTVVNTIKNINGKESHSILYEVDFIQLSHFLFKPYSLKDTSNLPEVMNGMLARELSEHDKKEIQNYIPRNNWDRYFSDILDMESDQLESKWKSLYEIRNKIAHNKSLKNEDLKTGNELCDFLLPIIEDAICSLEKIEVPEEERDSISMNSMATMNEELRPFVDDYQNFSTGIIDTIRNNQEIFESIKDISSPIKSFINAINIKSPFENAELANALSSIENSKDMMINAVGIGKIPLGFDSMKNELFYDAGSRLAESYKGVIDEWPESISFYINRTQNAEDDFEGGRD
ncbi:MAG: HEPN domain-containing protein [Allomuricauda sp.]